MSQLTITELNVADIAAEVPTIAPYPNGHTELASEVVSNGNGRRKPKHRINFLPFTFFPYDGYGRFGLSLLRALSRAGIACTPVSTEMVRDMPGWVQRLAGVDFSKLNLAVMSAAEVRRIPGRQWLYTMFEATQIPDGWSTIINQTVERLVVPSEWLVDVFYQNGVKKNIPIDVVHGGIEPEECPIIDRSHYDRPYTFLVLADRAGRKGDTLAWSAFYKAFGDNPDVRLVLKCRAHALPHLYLAGGDVRYSVWREDVPNIADVLAYADCYLAPCFAEGWGMQPREAAATGLPVIATNWSGLSVGIEHWAIPVEKHLLVHSPLGGMWAKANVDELAEKMRWCYEHREEAAAIGLKAAHWLRANQTTRHQAEQMIALFDTHLIGL